MPAARIVANHLPLIVNPADRKFSYAAYHVIAEGAGINYAMDAVDMKLFNSAETSPSTVAAEGAGIVYAMDAVDLKLFNSAETVPTTVAAK